MAATDGGEHEDRERDRPPTPSSSERSDLRRTMAECYRHLRDRDRELGTRGARRHVSQRSMRIRSLVGTLGRWCAAVCIGGVRGIGVVLRVVFRPVTPLLSRRTTWIVLGGLSVVGVGGWFVWRAERLRYSEKEVHRALTELVSEFRRLRETNADAAQWETFDTRAQKQLARLQETLTRHARVEDPVSMLLFWSARDSLPAMLADARETVSDSERQFDRQMTRVEYIWLQRERRGAGLRNQNANEPTDWSFWSIVLLDVLLLPAGVWWFRRRWA